MIRHKNVEVGSVYGLLKVISKAENRNNRVCWNCLCECGIEKSILGEALRYGINISCGCKRKKNLDVINSHRKESAFASLHPKAYSSWHKMIDRCTNPNSKQYSYYGLLGVSVCKEWLDLKKFFADMGDPLVGMTIDRIDNSLGYFKENCRWADKKTQSRNRSSTKLTYEIALEIRSKISIGQSTLSLSDEYGVTKSSILSIKSNQCWKAPSFIQEANSTKASLYISPQFKDLFEFREQKVAA